MDDRALEAELAAKATAPRVTLQHLEDEIAATHTFNLGDALAALGFSVPEDASLTTICAITTKLGFVLVGTSACVSKDNYNPDIGGRIAKQKAFDQLWPLEGYRLKAQLEDQRKHASAIAKVNHASEPAQTQG
jgi:hypothetical protein